MRHLLVPLASIALAAAVPVFAVTQGTNAADEAQAAANPGPDLEALNVREATLAARIGVNRSRLAHLLGALQRFSRDPPPPLLIPPEDARDSVRAAILIRAMTPELERRARALAGQSAELARLRRAAAAADADRFVSESEAADLQRVDGLFAASRPDDLLPEEAGEPPTDLIRPLPGRATSGFGGSLASGAPSRGLEFAEASGAEVVSPSAGVVDYAGPLQGWGQVLILRAGGGYHMVLAGLGRISVRAGQSVASGQTIGAMPDGVNSGSRLYLEVRRGAEPINPAPLLAQTTR